MNRAVASLALAGVLLSASFHAPAVVLPPTYEEIFEGLAVAVDAGIAGIPSPAATKEEKKALRAWTAAGKAVARALAKPSPTGFTKAASKVDKVLSKAFPEDEVVQALLDQLAEDMVSASLGDLSSFQGELDAFPDGELKDALMASLGGISSTLADANGAPDRATLHRLCSSARRALAAVERKYNKALARAAGAPGMAATVDAAPFVAAFVEGVILVDPATGKAKQLSLNGFTFAGVESESVILGITFLGTENFVVPGTYAVTGLEVEGGYLRTGMGGPEEIINGEAGTITLVSIDPVRGTATGIFDFSGPNLGGGTGVVTSGRFNARNLVVTEVE